MTNLAKSYLLTQGIYKSIKEVEKLAPLVFDHKNTQNYDLKIQDEEVTFTLPFKYNYEEDILAISYGFNEIFMKKLIEDIKPFNEGSEIIVDTNIISEDTVKYIFIIKV